MTRDELIAQLKQDMDKWLAYYARVMAEQAAGVPVSLEDVISTLPPIPPEPGDPARALASRGRELVGFGGLTPEQEMIVEMADMLESMATTLDLASDHRDDDWPEGG